MDSRTLLVSTHHQPTIPFISFLYMTVQKRTTIDDLINDIERAKIETFTLIEELQFDFISCPFLFQFITSFSSPKYSPSTTTFADEQFMSNTINKMISPLTCRQSNPIPWKETKNTIKEIFSHKNRKLISWPFRWSLRFITYLGYHLGSSSPNLRDQRGMHPWRTLGHRVGRLGLYRLVTQPNALH